MNIEEKNIQALISMNAQVNDQDNKGDSLLHLALARYIEDQENYGVYKEVFKMLLKLGADRNIKNKQGYTPLQLLKSYESLVYCKHQQDYIDQGLTYNTFRPPENQYEKL